MDGTGKPTPPIELDVVRVPLVTILDAKGSESVENVVTVLGPSSRCVHGQGFEVPAPGATGLLVALVLERVALVEQRSVPSFVKVGFAMSVS